MKIDGTIYDADAIREMEAQAECAAAEIARLRAALDAMTAERDAARLALQEAAAYGCTCDPAFTDRGLAAPDCMANLVSDDAREALGLPRVCKGTVAIRAQDALDPFTEDAGNGIAPRNGPKPSY